MRFAPRTSLGNLIDKMEGHNPKVESAIVGRFILIAILSGVFAYATVAAKG